MPSSTQAPAQLLEDVVGPQRPVQAAFGEAEQRVSQVGRVQHARVEDDRERHSPQRVRLGVAVRSYMSASSAISTMRWRAARCSAEARSR